MDERRIIGQRQMTNGVFRPVFQDDEGQYVLDAEGVPVDGVWPR
jgi:hypothetical protein